MIITIKNMKLEAVIGVYEWEKKRLQPLIINARIKYDARKAAETDSIKDALSYIELTQKIVEEVKKTDFDLLEKLMNFVLDIIMSYPQVQWAEVEIDKPEAISEYAESVSLTSRAER